MLNMAASSLRKVLVIVGTTGAGKTKLSIDLAKAVGGEIINSDAMQMYRGLDIATAKITEQEKEGVPHHLFDIVEPSGRCDVLEYKRRALSAIDDILARGKVPIIVGGTMYYTQSILWKSQLLDDVPVKPDAHVIDDNATPEEIYAKLREVDPVMASRWHVNQVRRVRRSLEVFYQTGIRHSELIARQEEQKKNTEKYFDACAFWINCSKPVLADRLAKRVEKMMDTGLVDEITRLRADVKLNPPKYPTSGVTDGDESDGDDATEDHTVGILQAIGYKEFAPYLDALEARERAATEEEESAEVKADRDQEISKLLDSCIDQLNAATRQYARRQLSWIRNRFVTRNIPVYQVDSSDVSKWEDIVAKPAIEIAQSFLTGEPMTQFKSLQEAEPDKYAPISHDDKYRETFCEICGNRKFIGKSQWEMHLRSKGHKYHLKRIELEKQNPEWMQHRANKAAKRAEVERGVDNSETSSPKRAKVNVEDEEKST
ncbi:hypothetical protein Poli38472_000775 [Pythium oligandrum]|uniref:C2H2-type domain-containing protein n=1 Tax=Pythium oligandrum TaxID=41045 RepID=A0A8K1FJH0_PYTOL|nr:hypothetical protein Poli38472_000775 [Pythium oligandrum]|eukprot:TMW60733.1 hypothetical protein Poli38472_000775 [Pythium oligandrum]